MPVTPPRAAIPSGGLRAVNRPVGAAMSVAAREGRQVGLSPLTWHVHVGGTKVTFSSARAATAQPREHLVTSGVHGIAVLRAARQRIQAGVPQPHRRSTAHQTRAGAGPDEDIPLQLGHRSDDMEKLTYSSRMVLTLASQLCRKIMGVDLMSASMLVGGTRIEDLIRQSGPCPGTSR